VVLRLAKRLERAWRALPDVADAPCAPDLKSVDAIAEDGDPTTAVRIENLVFTNAAFRKMHLEVAWGLGGLEVMHVVVYPWASVAAPIYAADLVAFNGRVTLCIADVCPTSAGGFHPGFGFTRVHSEKERRHPRNSRRRRERSETRHAYERAGDRAEGHSRLGYTDPFQGGVRVRRAACWGFPGARTSAGVRGVRVRALPGVRVVR
jgi:hypothetical protein